AHVAGRLSRADRRLTRLSAAARGAFRVRSGRGAKMEIFETRASSRSRETLSMTARAELRARSLRRGCEPRAGIAPLGNCLGNATHQIERRWMEAMRRGDFAEAWRQTDRLEQPRRVLERAGLFQWQPQFLLWGGVPF